MAINMAIGGRETRDVKIMLGFRSNSQLCKEMVI